MSDYPTAVLRDHPILFARCNENIGAAVLADSSGHGRASLALPPSTLVAEAGAATTDVDRCILQTAGTTPGYAGAPAWPSDLAYAGNDFSVELWYRNPGGGIAGLLCGMSSTTAPTSSLGRLKWSILHETGNIWARVFFPAGGGDVISTPAPVGAGWVHTVFTLANRTIALYLNGVLIGARTFVPTVADAVAPRLGDPNYTPPVYMDEFALYDYALSAVQVARHYYAATGAAIPQDSSAIEDAVIATLRADAALAALMPDGVYKGVADPGAQRFVLVDQIAELDAVLFGRRRAFEDFLFLVKAVGLEPSGGAVRAAAARIDTILDPPGARAVIDIPGYRLMACRRVAHVHPAPENDDANPTAQWLHRGGQYQVMVAAAI
jgi:Concanavalin A-like lectin/glucanases superfamily